jgi:integrase
VVRAFHDRHWGTSSAATTRQRLAISRSFLKWLVGEGLLKANLRKTSERRKMKRKARDVLTREDIDALIAAQPSIRD